MSGQGDIGGGITGSTSGTLRSSATSRVVLAMCEGEIGGLVDADKSVYFGDTPLMAADGSYNFDGVTYETRNGTADQSYLAGFPDIENDVNVEADVTYASSITRRIDNASANAARVRLQLPQGLMSQDSGSANINATSVNLAIEVRPSGGVFTRVVEDTISGKTTSAYEKSYRVALTGNAPWDLRVVRLTADSESAYLRNATRWASYTEIIDRKCTYPYTALLGVAVDGKEFGSSVPTISAEIYGRILLVPANYDPETRAYTGIWDGTFKLAWTDNPAWCFYDMVSNSRYGLGLPLTGIDKWGLYEIAQYCDGLVPDGYGGLEPRFTCNLVLNTQEDAYQVISSMASIFRGMAYWASGSVACSQDRPEQPSHLVTPAHVVDGSLSYGGTDLKSRHTVCLVTWNNPADGYKPDIEVVENAAGIRRYGWRKTDKVSVGCTSRGMAKRCGEWVLETELNETDLLTFTGGLYYADAVPGSRLKVLDPEEADVRHGGAVKSASLDQVVLDAPVTIEPGQEYLLSVVLPDKTVANAVVVNSSGETDTLDLASPLSAAPLPGSAWVLSYAEVTPRYFRVVGNRETKPHLFEISAVEHDPDKYARVEQHFTFDAPSTSRVPTGPLAAPTGLAAQGYIYAQGGSPLAGAVFSWSAPADGRVATAEVEYAREGEAYAPAGTTTECSTDLRSLVTSLYSFRVRFITRLGVVSPWDVLQVQISADPPAVGPVLGLTATVTPTGTLVRWPRDTTPWKDGVDIALDGEIIEQGYAGDSKLIPPNSAMEHMIQVRNRDLFEQTGEWSTVMATPVAPEAPVVSAAIVGANVEYAITPPTAGSFPVVGYQEREGETWAGGTKLGTIPGTSVSHAAGAAGTIRRWFAAVDKGGNVGTPASMDVTIQAPRAPSVSARINGQLVEGNWTRNPGSLPLATSYYYHGATLETLQLLGQGLVSTSVQFPGTAGTHLIVVVDEDVAGNRSPAGVAELVISAPTAPSLAGEAITNIVTLRPTGGQTTLPLDYYQYRKGAAWATAAPKGNGSGTSFPIIESGPGENTYWASAVDIAGNMGPPASITISVSAPPGYVLHDRQEIDLSACAVVNAGYASDGMLMPMDTTESFKDHFQLRGWKTPDDQMNAGYPYYIQPVPDMGQVQVIIDYEVVLAGSRISVSPTFEVITGTVATSCRIETSLDRVDWTDWGLTQGVYATNFRYARITFTATPDS